MRVHGDVARDDVIFRAVDRFFARRFHRGPGEKPAAGSDIEEADVVETRMNFSFHGGEKNGSALARLIARFDFVDDVDLAFATHDLTGRVTLLGRFNGGNDFHKSVQNRERVLFCQPKCPPPREATASRSLSW